MRLFETFARGSLDVSGAEIARTLWQRQPQWAVASISEMDAAFFAGMVTKLRPRMLLEIGVASGWGSCVLLEALARSGLHDSQLYGVDISERFFYDSNYATGQCVADLYPEYAARYHLATGVTAPQHVPEIGHRFDFVFIDAHHMHPWAILDLLAVLPFVEAESWIALHDLNLSLKEDQEHRNRGPKYLFEGWDHDKMHSIQNPTMAGAIRIGSDASRHLPLLLDIVHTPWELPVDQSSLDALLKSVSTAYGDAWSMRFRRAFELANYHVNKVHSPEIGRLQQEIAQLRRGKRTWTERLLRRRGA